MRETDRVRAGYDAIAVEYADHIADDMSNRPVDRAFVAGFAELVIAEAGPGAQVADIGSGPGYQTALLHKLGPQPAGFDLSPRMVEVARQRHPHLRFEVGSMLALNLPTPACDANPTAR